MNYREKKDAMRKKYEYAVSAIAVANGVDMGVAFEMLRANILDGGKYPIVNIEEFKKDWEDLTNPTLE